MRTAASLPLKIRSLPVGLKITVRVSGLSLGRGLLTYSLIRVRLAHCFHIQAARQASLRLH